MFKCFNVLFPVWCLFWYRTVVYLTPPFLILLCMHVYLCRYKLIVWCLRIGLNGADHRHCRWRRRNATYSKANQSAYSQKNLRANLWAQKFIFRRLRRFKLVSQSIDGRIIPRIRIRCRHYALYLHPGTVTIFSRAQSVSMCVTPPRSL